MYEFSKETWNFLMRDHLETGGKFGIIIPLLCAAVITLLLNEWKDRQGSDLYQRNNDVRNTILKDAREKQDARLLRR